MGEKWGLGAAFFAAPSLGAFWQRVEVEPVAVRPARHGVTELLRQAVQKLPDFLVASAPERFGLSSQMAGLVTRPERTRRSNVHIDADVQPRSTPVSCQAHAAEITLGVRSTCACPDCRSGTRGVGARCAMCCSTCCTTAAAACCTSRWRGGDRRWRMPALSCGCRT